MNIVILDLEWNGAYSRRLHGFINEIIEFGAVKLDAQLNITDRFSCFVKPQVTKKISAVISDLTNITDANLLDARPYMQVMSRFKKWAGDCVIATWGTSDILALIENCRYFGGGETVPFLQRYVDLQQYVEKRLDEVYITVNKNAIPNDPEKPFVTSGIRVGTPAATSRGFREEDMKIIGSLIWQTATEFDTKADDIRAQVAALTAKYPLYA